MYACVRACVCVCVCVCVIFAGTTAPRISKFGTNFGYDLLYCAEENQPPPAYHFLYLSIFLSHQSNFNKKYTSEKLIKSSIM